MLGLAQKKDAWRLAPLVAATLVVAVGAYSVGLSAITDMQRSHAEYVARSFARHLLGEVPGLPQFLAERKPHEAISASVGAVKPIGSIISFKVFDQAGMLRAGSDLAGSGADAATERPAPNAVAASVLATRHIDFELKEGDGTTVPRYYSDIIIPFVDGMRTIGALHVLSDETESWPALFEQFRSVLLQVLGLVAVAFGMPLLLYLQKTGQLARTAVRLRQSTQYDALTGCLNRATFIRIMEDLIHSAEARGLHVAVHSSISIGSTTSTSRWGMPPATNC